MMRRNAFSVYSLALGVALLLTACGGSSGEIRPIAEIKAPDYHSLAVSPADPNLVFFGHHYGVLRSADGGRTWAALPGVQGDAMSLRFDSVNSNTMYLAGHEVFLRSIDAGKTWQPVRNNLPGLDIHAFAVHPEKPQEVFAFVVGFGLFKSENGGITWRLLSNALPLSTVALAITASGSEAMYAASATAGLLKSADAGKTWAAAGRNLGPRSVFSLAYDVRSRSLYAGTDEGLFKSPDGGETWTQTKLNKGVVLATALDPAHPGLLLAVNSNGRVFKSLDGGQGWVAR